MSVDAASNAAIRSFARSWTLDLKGRNIRVNAVSPGPTVTPGISRLAQTEEQRQQLFAAFAATVPLGRMADPDEIAKAVVFLASDESSFVNGIELFVDGVQAQISVLSIADAIVFLAVLLHRPLLLRRSRSIV